MRQNITRASPRFTTLHHGFIKLQLSFMRGSRAAHTLAAATEEPPGSDRNEHPEANSSLHVLLQAA